MLRDAPENAESLLDEVKRRGLSAYYWDGQLHFLPAKLAAANHDLIVKLHQQREAVRRELENPGAPGRSAGASILPG